MKYRNTYNPLDIRFGHPRRSRVRSRPEPDPKSYLPGHTLTEAIPEKAPEEPPTPPDADEFERTANSQRESALLRLPIEVRRQIYDAAWEEAGLTRHIYIKNGCYTHTSCITDHDAEDERQVELWRTFPIRGTFLDDPIWSRRLLSSWVNHWRCEEAAAAAAKGPPVPTPFLALLLCCKRMYVDCRKPLYEHLTFTFHRMETALDFLSIRKPAISSEIKSLQLSLQISAGPGPGGYDDIPPELPWHCTAGAWISLRDYLAELDNLRHLSVWLDACSPQAREYLVISRDLLVIDPRLLPIMRLSIPLDEDWWWYYHSSYPALPYAVRRGMTELWQEPSIAPHITFAPRYGLNSLYQVARHGGAVGGYRRRRSLREYLSPSIDFSKWKSRILPQ